MGESRERESLSGSYTEHFDDNGNKIGESRTVEGITGPYVEHRDVSGHKIGESRDVSGFAGRYTEHRNASGRKTGESRTIDGILGRYIEHRDNFGRKTGESRRLLGILGPYAKHEGSGWFGGFRGVRSADHDIGPATGRLFGITEEGSKKFVSAIVLVIWVALSYGGIFLANSLVDKNASLGVMLMALLIWLICLPGALFGLIPLLAIAIFIFLLGALR